MSMKRKNVEKSRALRRKRKTHRETSTTGLGPESSDGELEEELSDDDAPDWKGKRRVGGSLFHMLCSMSKRAVCDRETGVN